MYHLRFHQQRSVTAFFPISYNFTCLRAEKAVYNAMKVNHGQASFQGSPSLSHPVSARNAWYQLMPQGHPRYLFLRLRSDSLAFQQSTCRSQIFRHRCICQADARNPARAARLLLGRTHCLEQSSRLSSSNQ